MTRTADRFVLLVSGWRHATFEHHKEFIAERLRKFRVGGDDVVLRHGRCKFGGVDLIADVLAHEWGWETDPMPAEERGTRILGSPRNHAMCTKRPRPRLLVAFPGPDSIGTLNCIRWAAKYGIPFEGYPLIGGSS